MNALAGTSVAGSAVVSAEKLRGALLWLMAFAGAFVFIEPSPYEFVGLITILLFCLTGLTLPSAITPLILLLVLLNVGYATAVVQVLDQSKAVIWVAVSAYLALTAIFYAAVLAHATESRLRWLLRGYVAAAVVASLAGIVGYVESSGALGDLFLRYGRARGTFNDPNVLGAFLVLPGMLLLQRVLAGTRSQVLGSGFLLLILMGGLFLSFSRAAWGVFGLCAVLLMFLTFVCSRSPSERFRIVVIALVGVFMVAVFIAALLSISQIADLFQQRASLDQSYDVGPLGRFGRYTLGAQLAIESPFGIGPLQFARIFFEDPHNTFLNEFMSGGWLAGFAYLTLTLVTLVSGLRFIFVDTPWRPTYQAVYVAYLGVAGESAIIDINHWRHYFLVLGLVWGLMAVSRPYLRRAQDMSQEAALAPAPQPS
jgi:hypothetical protein